MTMHGPVGVPREKRAGRGADQVRLVNDGVRATSSREPRELQLLRLESRPEAKQDSGARNLSVKRILLYLTAIVVVLGGLGLGAVWAVGTVLDQAVQAQQSIPCPNPAMPYNCSVTPEFIDAVTGLNLPPGTKVVDGGTGAWTSWSLSVTVAIPTGAQAPPESTDGAMTSVSYKGLDSDGRELVSIAQTRSSGASWPKP